MNIPLEIQEKLSKLPAALLPELQNYLDFLLMKAQEKQKKEAGKLTQTWAGSLKEYRDKYTSLELQKKSMG